MATHDIQTVMEPWKTITVGDDEYAQLLRLGLVYSGSPVAPVADGTDLLFADKIVHGVATPAALKAAIDAEATALGLATTQQAAGAAAGLALVFGA